ncbi:MAG TPA: glycosyltransferase [Methylovirgula sp.]|nr:glycosyltransferase [Methylovirgula sp.]
MFDSAPDVATAVWTNLGLVVGALILAGALDRRHLADRALFGFTCAALLVAYALWRWHDTLPAFEPTAESWWAHLFFGCEMVAVTQTLLAILILLRHRDRTGQADAAERALEASGAWPEVDIFICTFREPLEVLEKSILSAAAIDYPHFTVWVLDDTRRAQVREFCAELGVNYLTRPDNTGAKGGNLNNALAKTAELTNAPVVLLLDADFAARPNILRRTVGLLADPSVAIVQTPQFYYNGDPIQHNLGIQKSWVDDQRFFFEIFEPAKDAWGCAFCVGTSCVIRRDKLEMMGGFPTESVTEDLHVSYKLMARGLKTIWLNERLSVGLSAEGLPEYLTQRARWCLGTIQGALLSSGPFGWNRLNFTQRWHYLQALLHWCSKPFTVLLLLAPPIYWFGGVPAFHADYLSFLRFGLPALICLWIYNFWISGARTLPILSEITESIAALAISAVMVRAFFKPFGQPFKVTDKGGDRSQPKIRTRLALIFGAAMALSLASIAWSFFSPVAPSELSSADLFNLLWAAVAAIIAFGAFLVSFERPRGEEEFEVEEETFVRIAGETMRCVLVRLSPNSAPITPAFDPADAPIQILVPNIGWIGARPGRKTGKLLALQLAPSAEQRHALIVRLFTSPIDNAARTVKIRPTVRALLRRAFQPERP